MTKIKLVSIGHLPANFNKAKMKNWKSSIFQINGDIESYSLTSDSDGANWEFSDKALESQLPAKFEGDFLIAIVNVPIELNWYSRRLGDNKVVFTFHEIRDILSFYNIPLENVIYRLLYAYTLVFQKYGNRLPQASEITNFTHDETRSCLFDMNGIKTDIIYSCNKPIICPECIERLKRDRVPEETIKKLKKRFRE